MKDILDGIASIREAFMAAHLKPPSTILLESHDEGMRFLSAVRQQEQWAVTADSPALGRSVEMADGSIWMGVEIMGIKVRWRANRAATRTGAWDHT